MEYMCNKVPLDWKIDIVERIITREIPKRHTSGEFGTTKADNSYLPAKKAICNILR